jgi:uncharacterized membrane protein YdjX (TVP38/TMEM64 family)
MSFEFLARWLESFGKLDAGSSTALTAVFVAAAFLPIPRTFLILVAGAAFGLGAITVIVPAATLGSILAFLLARGALRNWVRRQIDRRKIWQVVEQAVNDEGWQIVALMRLWGPMPSSAQNYLFGLTNIELLPYSLITLVCTFPQTALFIYLGASGRSALLHDGSSSLSLVWVAPGVITALAIVFLVSRRIRFILNHGSNVQSGN